MAWQEISTYLQSTKRLGLVRPASCVSREEGWEGSWGSSTPMWSVDRWVPFHHWGQVECWRLNTSIQGTWEEAREEERRESGRGRGSTASENSEEGRHVGFPAEEEVEELHDTDMSLPTIPTRRSSSSNLRVGFAVDGRSDDTYDDTYSGISIGYTTIIVSPRLIQKITMKV